MGGQPGCVAANQSPADTDALARAALAAMGARARVMPVIVFHGDDDHTIPYRCGQQTLAQWLRNDDLILQQARRSSLRSTPTMQAVVPGGHAYTVASDTDRFGCPAAQLGPSTAWATTGPAARRTPPPPGTPTHGVGAPPRLAGVLLPLAALWTVDAVRSSGHRGRHWSTPPSRLRGSGCDAEPVDRWNHRRWPLVDGVDDPDVIDPSQVHGGDPEVGVLYHQERYAPVSQLDGVGGPQFIGCDRRRIITPLRVVARAESQATRDSSTGTALRPEDRGQELPGVRYAGWTALDAGFIITLSVHYHDILVKIGVPKGVVVGVSSCSSPCCSFRSRSRSGPRFCGAPATAPAR